MKYIVIRSDSEIRSTVVGKASSRDDARIILRNDFEYWFWQKVSCSSDASFEEVFAEYEDDECGLSDDSAWMNGCLGTDFDWVIISTEAEDVLSSPMSAKQMLLLTSDEGPYVNGNVIIDLNEVIGHGLEEFLDLLSMRLTGDPCLMDINYKVIDTTKDGQLIIQVSGDVSEILIQSNDLFEEFKAALITQDKFKEFTGQDISQCGDDEEIFEIIYNVADQMSDEEVLKYYRKILFTSEVNAKEAMSNTTGSEDKKMTKQDVINMIECEIEGENKNFKRYMENNPDDNQRNHDHEIILSVYSGVLHDLNMLFDE